MRQCRGHVRDSRANAAPLDTPSHGDHGLEVIASDLRLPCHRFQRGDAGQRKDVAVGGADRQHRQLILPQPQRVRQPHPHASRLQRLRQLRGNGAGERCLDRLRHRVGAGAFH